MLRFIVLGQIPGTQVQVNFAVLILIGLIGLLMFEILANAHRKQALLAVAVPTKKSRPRTTVKKKTTKKKTTKKKSPAKKVQKRSKSQG